MPEPAQPTPEEREPADVTHVSGGVNVDTGGDTSIGGDVVGRDKVTQTTTITQVGMSPEAVRRLVITVGALVFVTALCFFSGGLAVGFAAVNALGRPVDSRVEYADAFADKLAQVNAVASGQPVVWGFTESELSAYFRHDLGPQIGIQLDTGRARFLPSDEVEFYGRWSGFFNLPVLVITRMETDAHVLYHTRSAAVRLFGNEDSQFGLIALPAFVVQPLVDAINADIGYQVVAKGVRYPSFVPTGTGALAPDEGRPLIIGGVKQ